MAPPPEVQCKENGQTRSSQGWGHWPAPPPCWRTLGSTSERPPRRTKKEKSPLWFSQSEAWLCMREPQSDNSFRVGFASLLLPSPEGTGPGWDAGSVLLHPQGAGPLPASPLPTPPTQPEVGPRTPGQRASQPCWEKEQRRRWRRAPQPLPWAPWLHLCGQDLASERRHSEKYSLHLGHHVPS